MTTIDTPKVLWTEPTTVELTDDRLGTPIGLTVMASLTTDPGVLALRVAHGERWQSNLTATIDDDWGDLGYGGLQVRRAATPGTIQWRRAVRPV